VGIIVKFNGTHWIDELNRVWDDKVRFSLPDKDVFVINANANPPAQLGGTTGYYRGVGTILFNMVVNPVSGKVYVSNTEAGNEKRFEGPGTFAGHSIRGHLHESRITVLGPAGSVTRGISINTSITPPAVTTARSTRSRDSRSSRPPSPTSWAATGRSTTRTWKRSPGPRRRRRGRRERPGGRGQHPPRGRWRGRGEVLLSARRLSPPESGVKLPLDRIVGELRHRRAVWTPAECCYADLYLLPGRHR
jgi:hypothetical protein